MPSVLPSNLLKPTDFTKDTKVEDLRWNNNSIFLGRIVKVLSPSNPSNRSKTVWEYEVEFSLINRATEVKSVAHNCTHVSSVSGLAEHSTSVFRKGVPVLIAFVGGNSNYPVILGASINWKKEDSSLHFEWEYNGINFRINEDGSVKLNFLGATDDKGVAKDETVSNTNFRIAKDGSITVDDNNGQKIFIDKTNKKIVIEATDKSETAINGWSVQAATVDIKATSTTITSPTIINGPATLNGPVTVAAPMAVSAPMSVTGPATFASNPTMGEPTLLGMQSMAAMAELAAIFISGAAGFTLITTPNPNSPTVLNPAIVAALAAWQAKWLSGQYLSKNIKVE